MLVSYGYGAGWYTWNHDHPECLYDAHIAQLVLNGADNNAVKAMAEAKWPYGYWGGASDGLCVVWLKPGTAFRIEEYDGAETLVTPEGEKWLIVPQPAQYISYSQE